MTWPQTEPNYGDYNYLRREVSMQLGFGANINLHEDEQEGLVNMLVQRGIRRFYTPPVLPGDTMAHEWEFLRPLASLTLSAPYTTGTIEVVAGVVTLTSGTWPADAADGELEFAGVTYTVNTRDSGTQLTLDDLTAAVASGTSFTLGYPQYDLPADFAQPEGPFTYPPGTVALYPPIEWVQEDQIRRRRQHADYYYRPTVAAIRPKPLDATVGTRWQVLFWPTPDDAHILHYRYRVNPGDLTTTNLYPYGGQPHVATWVSAVLYEVELFQGGGNGVRKMDFMERLKASVDHDRETSSPKFLGYGGDRSDKPYDPVADYSDSTNWHAYDSNIVNYVGQNP